MRSIHDVQKLVAALLTKAADPATTPAEREACEQRADLLVARYGVERAMAAANGDTDEIINKVINLKNPRARAKARLTYRLATAMRCDAVREVGATTVHVFGYASDMERLEAVYPAVELQMLSGVERITEDEVPGHLTIRRFRDGWLKGFADRVGLRLRAAEQQAVQEAGDADGRSTALVLVDRSRRVTAAMEAAFRGQLRTTRSRANASGYTAGSAAGDRADIGQRRLGGSRRTLGS
ncbi:hypothetical protein [Marinactinospora rubrisoli]|uniref:DUF7168 domain-containing protein n=1 Tax=Marinactinospora rubrisoli TaxID=2715399 RepID=A0ABW2KNG1_9ACTN